MVERRTVEPANLRVLAEGLKFPEGPVLLADGSVVVVEIPLGRITRVAPDGAVSVVAETGGGPNGLAVAPDGALLACNNGGCFEWMEIGDLLISGAPPPADWPGHGALQRIDLTTGEVTTLVTEWEGVPLLAPNDLVLDADGGVWFTDFGVRESMEAEPEPSAVYWCRPDGSALRRVIHPLYGPNGIGLSPDGSRLYVAECYDGRLLAWDVTGPGEVSGSGDDGEAGAMLIDQPGDGALFDSLGVDGDGWVCVGTLVGSHGITAYSPDGAVAESTPLPDPMVTNICFGDGTAYATLSATGKLVAFDWPRPGGRLNFTA